ncbi:MAG: aryl-sulfate sulfotransferase [Verrucomicrobiota bacterium]|nr:aryl-sulfate sulfotransferase [Verrucomicrobiota bacterium]
MKKTALFVLTAALAFCAGNSFATQADDTVITITGQTAGPTPFISQLSLSASDTSVLKSIQFTVTPKPGSVIRPLSGTYSQDYMVSRGYFVPPSTDIFLPVYGLYDGFTNTVTLTYHFLDGSSKSDSTTIATDSFVDQGCGYKTPTVLQARTDSTELSYDYIFIRSGCGDYSPVILDTDGELRWVSTFGIANALTAASTFFEGAAYAASGSTLSRVDLDGAITPLGDYSSAEITAFHHNIDPGKTGLLLQADTTSFYESVVVEIATDGALLKTWNLADIISAAMVAGGDDPNEFVFPTPQDWFHSNAVTYNRADDSVIVSSRENFLICLDYETGAIKWILGDQTKKWFTFPSLAQFAIYMTPGSLPPIGQHSTSISYDQHLLLFDNGFFGTFHQPPGVNRTYASPRKHKLNLADTSMGGVGTSTVVWNYERDQSVLDPICSSVYEDAPLNYLVDYAFVGGFMATTPFAELLGLDAAGNKIFHYQYPTVFCDTAYASLPLHLEKTSFPSVGPQALNISTRGNISTGDSALIGGFIVTGPDDKKVALRVLGPSLSNSGVAGTLADTVLTLFDGTGTEIATNDDWESDAGAAELTAEGLAPTDPAESATVQTLAPGAYTLVATGKDATSGIGLVEVYDLSPVADSQLANISTRGMVGTGDDVLIGGFIVGDVANATVVIRALGPSLSASGISDPLQNPTFTVFDINGVAIAGNDDWQDDTSALDITKQGLAPSDPLEATSILHLPAGAYTAVVSGAAGGSGIGLLEVYDLD